MYLGSQVCRHRTWWIYWGHKYVDRWHGKCTWVHKYVGIWHGECTWVHFHLKVTRMLKSEKQIRRPVHMLGFRGPKFHSWHNVTLPCPSPDGPLCLIWALSLLVHSAKESTNNHSRVSKIKIGCLWCLLVLCYVYFSTIKMCFPPQNWTPCTKDVSSLNFMKVDVFICYVSSPAPSWSPGEG